MRTKAGLPVICLVHFMAWGLGERLTGRRNSPKAHETTFPLIATKFTSVLEKGKNSFTQKVWPKSNNRRWPRINLPSQNDFDALLKNAIPLSYFLKIDSTSDYFLQQRLITEISRALHSQEPKFTVTSAKDQAFEA